jgi:hypothetical protein
VAGAGGGGERPPFDAGQNATRVGPPPSTSPLVAPTGQARPPSLFRMVLHNSLHRQLGPGGPRSQQQAIRATCTAPTHPPAPPLRACARRSTAKTANPPALPQLALSPSLGPALCAPLQCLLLLHHRLRMLLWILMSNWYKVRSKRFAGDRRRVPVLSRAAAAGPASVRVGTACRHLESAPRRLYAPAYNPRLLHSLYVAPPQRRPTYARPLQRAIGRAAASLSAETLAKNQSTAQVGPSPRGGSRAAAATGCDTLAIRFSR